ncbi:MAG: NAD-dependent epimerase/dehydratase family protein, partial [Chloroflexi bacterium]|nr:NAD-dependent epimerase/dehydratase family protein [Chloroflexota bacterium]
MEVARGDLTRHDDVRSSIADVDAVVHLAAILPPAAERNPALTRRVNVDGTRALTDAVEARAPHTRFVFSSSVSVYGDTSAEEHRGPGIGIDHPLAPDDVYARSKAESELVVRESRTDWVVLRISGVAVPVFQEPPAAWPFLADQRIQFVHRDDAVAAISAAVSVKSARHQIFNVAGGPTWRMKGRDYVGDYLRIVGLEQADAAYQSAPGHFDWYDTGPSQLTLGYQCTPYETYLAQIGAEVQRLMNA